MMRIILTASHPPLRFTVSAFARITAKNKKAVNGQTQEYYPPHDHYLTLFLNLKELIVITSVPSRSRTAI